MTAEMLVEGLFDAQPTKQHSLHEVAKFLAERKRDGITCLKKMRNPDFTAKPILQKLAKRGRIARFGGSLENPAYMKKAP
jgi:hypothetical protein